MEYTAHERAWDDRIYAALKDAKVEITEGKCGDLTITLAHLRGTVTACDGTMYWSVYGQANGERYFGDSVSDGEACIAYGRAAVIECLRETAEKVMARIDAKRRGEEMARETTTYTSRLKSLLRGSYYDLWASHDQVAAALMLVGRDDLADELDRAVAALKKAKAVCDSLPRVALTEADIQANPFADAFGDTRYADEAAGEAADKAMLEANGRLWAARAAAAALADEL